MSRRLVVRGPRKEWVPGESPGSCACQLTKIWKGYAGMGRERAVSVRLMRVRRLCGRLPLYYTNFTQLQGYFILTLLTYRGVHCMVASLWDYICV